MKKAYDIANYAMKGAEQKLQHFTPRSSQVPCMCGQLQRQNSSYLMETCTFCNEKYHGCLLQPASTEGICCYCISRQNDPANIVETILNEAFFNLAEPSMYANRLQFEFKLHNIESENDSRVDVRCFRAGEDGIGFPMLGTLTLNGKEVMVLKPLLENSNLKKRKDEPLTLKEESLAQKNVLALELPRIKRDMKSEYKVESAKTCFFLGIYLVRRVTRDELEDYVKEHSSISKQDSIQKFFRGGDNHIAFEGQKQSLKCPLTLEMIKVPVRGTYCTHFQVFCLRSQYFTQREKGRWMCPICRKKIFRPVMDLWVYELISQGSITEEDEMELVFQADGTYEWLKRQEQKEMPLIVSKAKPRRKKSKRAQPIKEEERPECSAEASILKRMHEINVEDLELEVAISRAAMERNANDDSVVINEDAQPHKHARNSQVNGKAKARKPAPSKPASDADIIVCQDQEEGELVEITPEPVSKKPPVRSQEPVLPVRDSKSVQPAIRPASDRLKRQVEMNVRFNNQLDVQRVERIKESLTTTNCEEMSLHELSKNFEQLRVRQPKKLQFSDNFPNLFRFHS